MRSPVPAAVALVSVVGLIGLVSHGCTPADRADPRPPPADAGPPPTVLRAPGYGLQVDLAPGWTALSDGVRPTAPARVLPEARRPSGGVRPAAPARILSEAQRPAPVFTVPPKLVFTAEPCPPGPPAQVFRDTLATLRALDKRRGVRVVRTGLLMRTLPEGLVGEIDLVYRIEAQDMNPAIVHRSLAMSRPEPPRGRTLVTLTATYLQADAPMIGPEVDRMFASFRIERPR